MTGERVISVRDCLDCGRADCDTSLSRVLYYKKKVFQCALQLFLYLLGAFSFISIGGSNFVEHKTASFGHI